MIKKIFFALVLFLLCMPNAIASKISQEKSIITGSSIWISAEELANLPTTGPAWENMKRVADTPTGLPKISDQSNMVDVQTMAKALVYTLLHEKRYREEVINNIFMAIGTEWGARTIALGKNLTGYIIAADLVGLPPEKDRRFKEWLRGLLTRDFKGKTIISTNEKRPNNWGTSTGSVRAAIAVYLGDDNELQRTALVFKGYLGDRKAYSGFKFKHVNWWQADPYKPVGINPKGATKIGYSIDGVLPDDQRRSGPFTWPPPKENYVYTGLQGAVSQAVILYRAGYSNVWKWENKALFRAFQWLYDVAHFPPKGDDTWLPYVINYYYGTHFSSRVPSKPGKIVGWTDWTHGPWRKRLSRLKKSPSMPEYHGTKKGRY